MQPAILLRKHCLNQRIHNLVANILSSFPDNSGHYIENTGDETLEWVEIYKSDRVVDISLSQWLALTPPNIVVRRPYALPQPHLALLTRDSSMQASTLNVTVEFVNSLKKEKQLLLPGNGELDASDAFPA